MTVCKLGDMIADRFEQSSVDRVSNSNTLHQFRDGELCAVCLLGAMIHFTPSVKMDERLNFINRASERLRECDDTYFKLKTLPTKESMIKFFRTMDKPWPLKEE